MPDLFLKKGLNNSPNYFQRGQSPLFFIVLALFVITAAAYGGLFFLNRAQDRVRQELKTEVGQKIDDLSQDASQISALENRLNNLQTVLAGHIFSSKVFQFLESRTHPQIRFTDFVLQESPDQVSVGAETTGFVALAQQIYILQNDPQVESVSFGGLSISERNLLGFRLIIVFKSGFLRSRPTEQ